MVQFAHPARSGLTILQLVPESLPTFRADVATLFGKYLPRHGVHCDLVGMPGAAAVDAADGFASLRRPPFAPGRWRRELAFAALCLRSLLAARKGCCDLIQVRDMVPVALPALLLARWRGIGFVYWMSFPMSEGRIERARRDQAAGGGWRCRLMRCKGVLEQALLYRLILPRADHVFVQSEALRAQLVARGIAAARLSAVPMGVDTEALAAGSARRPPGWESVPLLAYLGTLDRMRGLDVLLDALALLRVQHPRACLLLIGDAAARADVARLLARAAALGLADAVRVTGWLPTAIAWEWLRGADAAISYVPRGALYDVSSPTKLLEYLALGVPCVGNDNPDQCAVLTASGAGWLTRSDAPALATALAEILAAPAAARARAAAGPAYIEARRSYRVLAAMVAERYRRIAAAG